MESMGLRGIRPPQALTVGDVGSYGILNGAYGPYLVGEGSCWPVLALPACSPFLSGLRTRTQGEGFLVCRGKIFRQHKLT
jgi:hypothetical protein